MGLFRKMMGKDSDATKPTKRGLSAPLQRSADEGLVLQLQHKIQILEDELQRAHDHTQQLTETLERQKVEAKDERTKDTLRFKILLDMFSLQALQNAQADEIEEDS